MSDTPETDEAWRVVCNSDYRAEDAEKLKLLLMKLERERDQYAAVLCDAMRWVYASSVTNQNRMDMINRFESLELTPAICGKNQTTNHIKECHGTSATD